MRGWLVYLTRALRRLLGVRIAQQRLADSRVLVGITFLDPHGGTVEYFQTHGRVISANRAGIVLERTDGRPFVLPPSPQWLKAAQPGEYMLRSTGEVVVDPDYLLSVTLQGVAAARIEQLKAVGFERPGKHRASAGLIGTALHGLAAEPLFFLAEGAILPF